jgi:ADP-ribose pyrophosphatase YjhB (NUDIX family)
LWIKRATEPYKGYWALPGGFVEYAETIEEATCREVLEETGLILTPGVLSLNGVASVPEMNQIYISLIAPLPSLEFKVTRESSAIRLARETQMTTGEYAYPAVVESWLHSVYERVRNGQAGKGPAIMRSYRSKGVSG